jgi:hypothetical protein
MRAGVFLLFNSQPLYFLQRIRALGYRPLLPGLRRCIEISMHWQGGELLRHDATSSRMYLKTKPLIFRCRVRDLNSRPTVYKTAKARRYHWPIGSHVAFVSRPVTQRELPPRWSPCRRATLSMSPTLWSRRRSLINGPYLSGHVLQN